MKTFLNQPKLPILFSLFMFLFIVGCDKNSSLSEVPIQEEESVDSPNEKTAHPSINDFLLEHLSVLKDYTSDLNFTFSYEELNEYSHLGEAFYIIEDKNQKNCLLTEGGKTKDIIFFILDLNATSENNILINAFTFDDNIKQFNDVTKSIKS